MYKLIKQRLFLFEFIISFVAVIFIVFSTSSFDAKALTIVNVNGVSMQPTLQSEDKLIIQGIKDKPKRGDIIVFRLKQLKDTRYIKRVVAIEGQTVNIDYNLGKLFIDDKEMQEPYTKGPIRVKGNVEFPVTVPTNSVFVLGDNRNNSKDSRFSDVGMVENSTIIGRIIFRIWPFETFGRIK